jgi:two-component sensor histidine kinase
VVSVDLPPQPSSASRARALARERVAGLPTEVVDIVALLVTELVTNAVLHARTELHLEIDVHREVVVLRVFDGSTRAPVIRHYGIDDVTGRGVALVDALASRWGVETTPTGKCVWCEIAILDRTSNDGEVTS